MANPSKQKGTVFETSLLPVLRKLDPRVERSALKGGKDTGDYSAIWVGRGCSFSQAHSVSSLEVVVSAKNCKQLSLSGWLSDAEKMRVNAGANAAIVVHKKRGTTAPEEQYVSMTLGTLLRLLT